MQCEVCDAIERLGLDPSAHDLWFCSAPHTAWSPSSRPSFRRLFSIRASWQHEVRRVLSQVSRHFPRLHMCPAYQRIIRLGL